MSRLRSGRRTRSTAEPRFAGHYDGLIAVLDLNLVEESGDVIADRLFGKPKRSRYLRVIESFGDGFEHRSFTRRKLAEWQ
jgi:hypothetical protein